MAQHTLPSWAVVVGLARDGATGRTLPENRYAAAREPDNQRKSPYENSCRPKSIMQIALVLPISCIVGWAIGDFLDHKLHQSWIGIAGLAVGVAAGFIQVIRMANHANRSDDNK